MIILFNKVIRMNEGIEWTTNPDGTVSLFVNTDLTDAKNKGTNSADTRVFGNKVDILYGDGTGFHRLKSLTKTMQDKIAAIQLYNDVIRYVNGGRKGDFNSPDNVDPKTAAAVKRWLADQKSDNYIIDAAKKSIKRLTQELDPYLSTYQRVLSEKTDRVVRYTTGKVNGTNVRYIALFNMTDFNFSDAIKHGTIRQNGNTDAILGIDQSQREKGYRDTELRTIPIKYDGGIEPDITANFSLTKSTKDHPKTSFTQGDGRYTSVNQFIDKSVNYAAHVLRKEGFHPDFIVAPPSSSVFNDRYCRALAMKIGSEYLPDFYERDLVNVRFDGDRDVRSMRDDGFSDKEIMEFESQVKNIAYKEIAYEVTKPIRDFVESHRDLFSGISKSLNSREKAPLEDVLDCILTYAYRTITSHIKSGDIVASQLANIFMSRQQRLYNRDYDSLHILKQVSWVIKLKTGKKPFQRAMSDMYDRIIARSKELEARGYELRLDSKRFKLTQIKKQFRPYLHGIYVVADRYTREGSVQSRLRGKRFLIFDEDSNSGATLKLCVDALRDRNPQTPDNDILCLVNSFSDKGW